MTKLLFLSGSTRKGSYNTAIAKLASKMAIDEGSDAEFIDLADYEMPIFNEDFEAEQGMPETTKQLKRKFAECEGFFISCPEYNSSYTPLLKNTLDWITRPGDETTKDLKPFSGKIAAIVGASPGGLGGIRMLVPLRLFLSNIGVDVIGNQMAIPKAHEALGDDGNIVDTRIEKNLKALVKNLVEKTN